MYRDYRAIEVSQKPSILIRTAFGTLKAAGRKLGVRPQSINNWDRMNRVPLSVWKQMMETPSASMIQHAAVSEKVVFLRIPYRLGKKTRKVSGLRTHRVTDTPASPAAHTPVNITSAVTFTRPSTSLALQDSLADKVARLEQENAELRQRFAALRDVLGVTATPDVGAENSSSPYLP